MLTTAKNFIFNRKAEIWQHGLATLAAVVSRLSMLLITLINTQFLSSEEFGLFAILSLIVNIVMAFVSCGGDMWLNRFCRYRHMKFGKAPIVTRFYLQISLGLASVVVMGALGFAIFGRNTFDNQGLAIALCLLWAAASGLMETVLAILRTTNEIHRFFMIRDLFLPITLMVTIAVLKINTALEFFLIALILWSGTLLFLLTYMIRRASIYMPRSIWTWQYLRKELIGYTANLVTNNFTSRIASSFDTLLLARILPIGVVGRYRLVAHFANAFSVIQHFVFLTLPWHFRQQNNVASIGNPRATVRFRQQLLLLSALPALLILTFAAKPLLSLLGTDYESMSVVLCLLLLIRFSELLWGPQHETLISNNEVSEDTKANLVSIVLGMTLFFSGLYYMDPIKSAVAAIAVASFSGQLTRFYAIKRKLKSPNTAKLPWGSVAMGIMALSGLYFV